MHARHCLLGAIASGLLLLGGCSDSGSSTEVATSDCTPAGERLGYETDGMPRTEAIFSTIQDMVDIGYRRSGTPEVYQAAAYVRCQFEALGMVDVGYERAETWMWEADRHDLEVAGESIDSFPMAHSFVTPDAPSEFSTGPDGLQAEIVDIGSAGNLDMAGVDLEGKIALFDLTFDIPNAVLLAMGEFLWDPGLTIVQPLDTIFGSNPYISNISSAVEAAKEAGAAGVVGVLVDYFDSKYYYNEFYRALDITMPGLWVTAAEGERIRSLMADEAPTMARLDLEGRRELVEARSVIGVLPGKSRETIHIQSHHDSTWDGAVQDGSGVAVLLAMAEYFAQQPVESREKSLMFTTFDTHFTGYQAHQAFVEKYVTEQATPYELVANVTVEHIAKQAVNNDGALELTGLVEPRGIMQNLSLALRLRLINEVIEHDLRRTVVMSANRTNLVAGLLGSEGLPTDASFMYTSGVPTVSLIAGPLYLYDRADTIDKVAVDELLPMSRAMRDLVEAIDDTPAGQIGGPPLL